jgi:signal transduction histidine kinase
MLGVGRAGLPELDSLVNGIVGARELETGQLAITHDLLAPGAVADEAAATIRAAAEGRGIHLDVAVSPDVPAVNGDPTLLRRALENFLSNAVKYAPSDSTITVTARPEAGGVALEVLDRGPGVSPDVQEQLFSKFGAAEKGHGVGLYFVKLVAEAHGGTVSAASREGGGSVFRLWLPAAPSETPGMAAKLSGAAH